MSDSAAVVGWLAACFIKPYHPHLITFMTLKCVSLGNVVHSVGDGGGSYKIYKRKKK